MRPASSSLSVRICLTACLLLAPHLSAHGEAVVVPGGPAAIRRLLKIESERPEKAFFLDVHRTLLTGSNPSRSWSDFERRVAVVRFVEDLGEWKTEQGCPTTLSTRGPAWKKTRNALSWLGMKVRGEGSSLEIEPKADPEDLRRQAFLGVLGYPASDVVRQLRAGEDVTVTCGDAEVDLPWGLTVWQDTLALDANELRRENAFLEFVKSVLASRMLVSLHGLDGRTREEVRTLIRAKKGSAGGWRILYDQALDGFARYPEALVMREGRFQLPGGPEADDVWADVVGSSTSDRIGFLTGLFNAEGGKAAYVVDALRQLPPAAAKAVVLGKTGGGEKAVKRFRRFYGSIESAGGNFERSQRDPYDFTHLVRFLQFSDEGDIVVPGGAALWLEALSGSRFPETEGELAELLLDAKRRKTAPEDFLRKLFRREMAGAVSDVPAQKRFLLVSGLLHSRPVLQDPGTILLLFRGLERFLPAYAPLEDVPLEDPAIVRRYLFTLNRLDTQGADRAAEVRAGLFLATTELLSAASRSGALPPPRARALFASLLDLPLFAAAGTSPEQGIGAFASWMSRDFLSGLREEETAFIEGTRREKTLREGEYRAAVAARDQRVVEKRDAARAARESARETAANLLAFLTSPGCPGDDSFVGPQPAPALLDADWLALELKAEQAARGNPDPASIADAEAFTRAWATVLVSEALHGLRLRARPLPPESTLPRLDGELPDVHPVIDSTVPLPALVRVDIPVPARTADDLVSSALAGFRPTVSFTWRGATYRFDPSADSTARKAAFLAGQQCVRLESLENASRSLQKALESARAGDAASTRTALVGLGASLSAERSEGVSGDERVASVAADAHEALEDLQKVVKPKALAKLPERLSPVEALRAERTLEALVLHVYSASAGDPSNLFYGDPLFVRRHSLRWSDPKAGIVQSPFGPTRIEELGAGKGSRIAGSFSGLSDSLGLLHVEQLVHRSHPTLSSEHIKGGLLGPVVRVTPARLDDDALAVVALSCGATEELAQSLASEPEEKRQESWIALARGLVPQARLVALSASSPEEIGEHLSPSDLYRIGRRLALGEGSGADAILPTGPSATAARKARERMTARLGEAAADLRLAEFGPRPVSYAGRSRLADIEMPSYERLSEYRFPQLFADRLYDIKIGAARMAFQAADPAALLGIYLEPALDTLLGRVRTAYVYDWRPLALGAASLGRADRDTLLEAAVESGRITRTEDEVVR